ERRQVGHSMLAHLPALTRAERDRPRKEAAAGDLRAAGEGRRRGETTQEVRSGLRYMVTTAAPPRPRLCCSATFAPSTWRFSARPRSCQLSSAHCARPVAPSGCPLEMRPPDGFTTHVPP